MNRIVHGGRQRETTAGKFSHDNLWLRASRVTTLRNEYKRLGIIIQTVLKPPCECYSCSKKPRLPPSRRKFYHHVHNILQPGHILSEINRLQTFKTYSFTPTFNQLTTPDHQHNNNEANKLEQPTHLSD